MSINGEPVSSPLRNSLLDLKLCLSPDDNYNIHTRVRALAIVDRALREYAELVDKLEQERVRLAGVLTVAEGHFPEPPVKEGDYGWSLAYQTVFELRKRVDKK